MTTDACGNVPPPKPTVDSYTKLEDNQTICVSAANTTVNGTWHNISDVNAAEDIINDQAVGPVQSAFLLTGDSFKDTYMLYYPYVGPLFETLTDCHNAQCKDCKSNFFAEGIWYRDNMTMPVTEPLFLQWEYNN